MSNAVEAFHFDFVNKNNFPPENKKIEIEVIKKGKSFGIVQWIKLGMDNGLKHENHPSNLTTISGWQNILYVFENFDFLMIFLIEKKIKYALSSPNMKV